MAQEVIYKKYVLRVEVLAHDEQSEETLDGIAREANIYIRRAFEIMDNMIAGIGIEYFGVRGAVRLVKEEVQYSPSSE